MNLDTDRCVSEGPIIVSEEPICIYHSKNSETAIQCCSIKCNHFCDFVSFRVYFGKFDFQNLLQLGHLINFGCSNFQNFFGIPEKKYSEGRRKCFVLLSSLKIRLIYAEILMNLKL